MTAMLPITGSDASPVSCEDQAWIWRGRYVEEFASAEVAVSEALARLHALASIGARSLLPAAVGQRFEVLQNLVVPGGPLAQVGCRVAKALDDLREHRCLRNFLCHGSSEVSIDGQSAWRLTLFMTSFRSGAVERSNMQVTAEKAAVLLKDLRSARLRLDGQLLGMLASMTI